MNNNKDHNFEKLYKDGLQGPFYGEKYYRERDREEESAIVYSDDTDKRLFSYMIKDFFRAPRILELGCAMGYLLKQLIGYGLIVRGIDFSQYCIDHVPPEVKKFVQKADMLEIPFPPTSFDMVVGLDILEHIPPSLLPKALSSIRRVLKPGGIYFGVIPAYGPNLYGPMVFDYRQKESWIHDAEAGRPFRDIPLDVDGQPHMGHLIHATVDWWEKQFSFHGFERLGAVEQRIHLMYDNYLDIGRLGLFVFRKKIPNAVDRLIYFRSTVDKHYLNSFPYRPQGFYNWEYWPHVGWARWTNVVSTEVLKRRGRYVLVSFLVDHPDCSEFNPVIIQFTLNFGSIITFRITEKGWKLARLAWKGGDRIGILHITISRTFTPAESGDSDDHRQLGIALGQIRQKFI